MKELGGKVAIVTAASKGIGARIARHTGRVEIKEVPADKPICKIETSLRNEAGDICLSGTATVYMSGSQSE